MTPLKGQRPAIVTTEELCSLSLKEIETLTGWPLEQWPGHCNEVSIQIARQVDDPRVELWDVLNTTDPTYPYDKHTMLLLSQSGNVLDAQYHWITRAFRQRTRPVANHSSVRVSAGDSGTVSTQPRAFQGQSWLTRFTTKRCTTG